MSMNILDYR